MRKAGLFLLTVILALALFQIRRHFPPGDAKSSVRPLLPAAPDLWLTDLNGNSIHTDGYKGKVVLVNFWAAWCTPCAEEIPQFMELQEKYQTKLQVIGISIDDQESELRSFYKDHKMNYPVIPGDQKTADAYGGVLGLPTTYIIDQENHVRGRQVGATDFQKLEQQISSLLR
jgi:thiol-disulfide isomerase/thioredoxin